MKKLLALILAFTCAVATTACNKDANTEKQKKNGNKNNEKYEMAVWEDYDKMPFMDFLKKGYTATIEDDGENIDIDNIYCEKGWTNPKTLNKATFQTVQSLSLTLLK